MNSPVRLGDSPAASIPTGFLSQRFGDFIFPAMEPWLERSVSLPVIPPTLSAYKCGTTCSTSWCLATPVLQPPPFYKSSPPWLPLSALPTVLDECFFISLVVGFHTIRFSGSSGYFLFLNLLFFFRLCEEVMCIPTLPSWPEVRKIDILKFMNGNVNVWVYIEFVSFPSLLIFGHFILFLECMVIFP